MNATDAQIAFITKLQADASDAPITDRETYFAFTGTQMARDARVNAALSQARALREGSFRAAADALTLAADAMLDANEAAREARLARRANRTDETDAAYEAAQDARYAAEVALAAAVEDDMWTRHLAVVAAINVDPTTLTKDEASRVIDLLK